MQMTLSPQTKITVGLAVTAAGILFGVGAFFSTQAALAARVEALEKEKQKVSQMSEDIAVIRERVSAMDNRLSDVLKTSFAK